MKTRRERKTVFKNSPSSGRIVASPKKTKAIETSRSAKEQAGESQICCEFCPQTFDSKSEKNSHVLQHFAQEFCTSCDNTLVRIGDALYVLHSTLTCIKNIKREYDVDYELNDTDIFHEVGIDTILHGNKVEFNDNDITQHFSSDDDRNGSELDFSHEPDFFGNEGDDEVLERLPKILPGETVTENISQVGDDDVEQDDVHRTPPKPMLSEIAGNISLEGDVEQKTESASMRPGYNCEICNATVATKSGFRRHLQRHEYKNEIPASGDNEKYDCDICGASFKAKWEIHHHMRNHISPEEPKFQCELCEKMLFTNSGLRRHLMRHDKGNESQTSLVGEEYKCDICGASCITKAEIQYHMKRHVPSQEHEFQCEICNKPFQTKSGLRRHLKNHKDGHIRLQKHGIPCEICNKLLQTKSGLRRHLRNHEQNTERKEQSSEAMPKSDSFTCEVCGTALMTKSGFNRHMLTHDARPKTERDIIADEIRKEKDRERSKKDRHCKYDGCDFVGRRRGLEAHVNRVHLGIRFTCDVCGKDISSKKNLKTHMTQHDPNRERVDCTICGTSLAGNAILRQHMQMMHGDGMKRYTCRFCGKGFVGPMKLREHEAVHTGEKLYTCSFPGCGKQFRQKSGVAEHQRVHSGVKPFKCDQEGCNQLFGYAQHVKRHKANIHGIWTKRHNCQICSDAFPTNAALVKHMNAGHDVELLIKKQ